MKRNGSTCDFKEQRDRELTQRFRELLVRSGSGESLGELFGSASRCGASRYWVSEHRAAKVVCDMLHRGDKLEGMIPQRRRMFEQICEQVKELLKERPDMAVYHAVTEVVNSPAPEFYLTEKSAKVIIYKYMRKRREEKRRTAVIASITAKNNQHAAE